MTSDPITDLCAVLRGDRELPAGEEGDRLVALARRHRVDRLLPVEPHTARFHALLDELAVRQLCEVVALLDAEGLEPLLFKGAALAHTHYTDSWRRPRLDADVLIASERRSQAFEILRQLGYREPPVVSGDLISYQSMFVRPDEIGGEHVVDLHWRIGNPQVVAHTLTHSELIARANHIVVRGTPVRVPSSVDALLLACVHRAAHHADADDLIWLYDIHLVATRLDAGEWTRLVDLALDRQVAAICRRGLALVTDYFHTDIPANVMERLLTRREPSAIFLRKDLRAIDRLASDLRLLGPRQSARLLREHLFPPASYVREKYRVRHRTLLPAFYAYRILAGASKWLRGQTPLRIDSRS